MRTLLTLFILTWLPGCNEPDRIYPVKYQLANAKDAFDYPKLNQKDTGIYVYQLKEILDKNDSLVYVQYGSAYLKQFNEQNFSLRPFALETFRFTYGDPPINITFDQTGMTVKVWSSGILYPIDSSAKFTFTTKNIKFSTSQYNALLDSLKKSNFDALPWQLKYHEKDMDSGGYTFEANTHSKFKYFVCYGMTIDTLPMTKFCRHLLKVANLDKQIHF